MSGDRQIRETPVPGVSGTALALDALYETLPTIECKGLCARSCGPILSTLAEAERAEANGVETDSPKGVLVLWDADRKLRCHKLRNGRCTVYAERPAICRLWGVADGMPCLWGCEPDRMLSREEAHAFLDAVAAVPTTDGNRPCPSSARDVRAGGGTDG